MPVEVPPAGTRGVKPPSANGALIRFGMRLATLYMQMRGLPVVHLTTVGARTGRERTTDLIGLPDGDNAWVVTASYAGAARHPAWFFNMARNPDKIWLRAGGRNLKVQADTLTGAEREAAWDRLVAVWSGYAGYKEKTDRDIPVVRLTATETA